MTNRDSCAIIKAALLFVGRSSQEEYSSLVNLADKPRIRAFAEFARRYGVEELEKCLLRNKEKGTVYHYGGQLVGDYDKCQTQEEIIELIKTGK